MTPRLFWPLAGGIAFNIPPQPLGTALEIYAGISSREPDVLVRS